MRFWFTSAFALLLLASPALAQSRIDQLGAASAATGTNIIPTCQGCNSSTAAVGLTLNQMVTFFNANLTIPLTSGVSGILPVANGGTGTSSPALVAGTNVTITGSWPDQTISASGGGSSTITANSTATSGFSANQLLYSDGSKVQAATVGSGLSFTGGNLTATGGGATTGVGVDGGTSQQAVTGTATINNAARTVSIGTGWATGTLTLPAISAVSSDTEIDINDQGGNVTSGATLSVAPNAADGIANGSHGAADTTFTQMSTVCYRVTATHNWTRSCSGIIQPQSVVTHQWVQAVEANGQQPQSQPAFTDISGAATAAQMLALSNGDIYVGNGSNQPAATAPGSNVLTAFETNLSAAGGLSSTIASGTSALGTSAIGSGACASAVTTSATNTATTDVILAGFNSDPTGVTGYAPATTGMLTIIPYPTANNVNFKVCNNTSSSITPGAITLNWRVVR